MWCLLEPQFGTVFFSFLGTLYLDSFKFSSYSVEFIKIGYFFFLFPFLVGSFQLWVVFCSLVFFVSFVTLHLGFYLSVCLSCFKGGNALQCLFSCPMDGFCIWKFWHRWTHGVQGRGSERSLRLHFRSLESRLFARVDWCPLTWYGVLCNVNRVSLITLNDMALVGTVGTTSVRVEMRRRIVTKHKNKANKQENKNTRF